MSVMFQVRHIVPAVFGQGSSKLTGQKLKEMGCTKVFVCFDKGIEKAGLHQGVVKSISDAGIDTVIYNEAELEPTCKSFDKAAELARAEQVDGIVGVGGGSSMDTAKGVSILVSNPGKMLDWIYYKPNARKYPLILIPTTAGTSTEVAPNLAVTDDSTGKKNGSPHTASLALVDPELLIGCPPFITATTGFDILAHTIESYTNPNMENWMSDYMNETTVELVYKHLPIAVRDGGNLEARTQVSFACLNTGYAFGDKGTHMGHALADTTHMFFHDISHGLGTAFSLPVTIRSYATICPEKIRKIGEKAGITLPKGFSDQLAGDYIAAAFRDFSRGIGIKNIKEYGVTAEGIEDIIKTLPQNFRFETAKFRPDFNKVGDFVREEFALN